jgi:hypothetical protein
MTRKARRRQRKLSKSVTIRIRSVIRPVVDGEPNDICQACDRPAAAWEFDETTGFVHSGLCFEIGEKSEVVLLVCRSCSEHVRETSEKLLRRYLNAPTMEIESATLVMQCVFDQTMEPSEKKH